MATVSDVLSRAARQVSITSPDNWATSTRLHHQELRDDFLRQTIDDILDRADLPAPIGKQTTITGTGAESYSLPDNFRRPTRDALAVYETTTLRRAGTPVWSDGAWTHLNTIGSAGSYRYIKFEGYPGAYTIKFERDLSTGQSVTFSYISNNWVTDGATESSEFTEEGQILMLPDRVVELGTVWRFRERKGLPLGSAYQQYEAYMSRLYTDSKALRVISFGDGGDIYKPMRVPVPDYIPSA